MKNKILILSMLFFFYEMTFAQVGINVKDLTSSLNIMQNNNALTQDTLLLRVKDYQQNDIFQQKSNGNLTIYNSLNFDNKTNNSNEVLVSNGDDKSPYWTDSVKKGVQIQVFNAQQNEVQLPPDPAGISTVTGGRYFTNPDIILDVSEDIGKWVPVENKFIVAKKGLFDISIGGNFYRTNGGPFGVNIIISDENNNRIYQVSSTDDNEIVYENTIVNYGEKAYNRRAFSSTKLIISLEPGYIIQAIYSTGGHNDTFMLANKTYFSIVYTGIN